MKKYDTQKHMMSLPMIYEGAVGHNDISVIFLIIYIFNYTTGQNDFKHVNNIYYSVENVKKKSFSHFILF